MDAVCARLHGPGHHERGRAEHARGADVVAVRMEPPSSSGIGDARHGPAGLDVVQDAVFVEAGCDQVALAGVRRALLWRGRPRSEGDGPRDGGRASPPGPATDLGVHGEALHGHALGVQRVQPAARQRGRIERDDGLDRPRAQRKADPACMHAYLRESECGAARMRGRTRHAQCRFQRRTWTSRRRRPGTDATAPWGRRQPRCLQARTAVASILAPSRSVGCGACDAPPARARPHLQAPVPPRW